MTLPLVVAIALNVAPGPTSAGPSFDCARATGKDEVMVCKDPALAALDRQMGETYAAVLPRLPKEDADSVRAVQKDFLKRRKACAGEGSAKEVRDCLAYVYTQRIDELEWDRDTRFPPDGFTIARIQSTADRLEVDIAYPVLAASRRGAAAFNAWALAQAKELAKRAGPEEEGEKLESSSTADFAIRLVTDRVVTVLTKGYVFEGGPHGLSYTTATTFDLERGKPITLEDLFGPAQPGKGWREAVRQKALARVREFDREGADEGDYGERPGAKEVDDARNWCFGAAGVVLTFPAYSIAPYAVGQPEARFTWDELRPLIRKDAPLPPR
jgi:uncharacterized protein